MVSFLKSVSSISDNSSPTHNGHSQSEKLITDDEQALYSLLITDFNISTALEKRKAPSDGNPTTGITMIRISNNETVK